jgi:uncharacterized protein (TIGR02996 family)
MSPELIALLAACKDTTDDLPRLVLADWLDENDDPERAELIRLQLALARGRDEDPDRPAQRIRAAQLVRRNAERWLGDARRLYDEAHIENGFLTICATPRQLLDHPPAELPGPISRWVEALKVYNRQDGLNEVVSSPILGCFSRIAFDRDAYFDDNVKLGNAGAERLAANPHLAGLRSLDLETNGVRPKGVAALAQAEQLAGLQRLRLYSNHLGDVGAVALAKAPWLANLVHLDIGDSGAQGEGLAALIGSGRLRGLKTFTLDNLSLDETGARALATSPDLGGLTFLDLRCTRLEGSALRILAESPFLRPQQLTIEDSCYPRDDSRGKLLAGSPLLGSVRELTLTAGLGQRGVRWFLASPRLAQLECLVLYAETGDVGCEVLAGADHFANLRILALQGENIGPRGAAALARSPHLGRLAALRLHGKIGPDGVVALAQETGLPNLEALELDVANAGARGMKALAASPLGARLKRLSMRGLGDRGVAALKHLPKGAALTDLDLESNGIGPAGAVSLAGCAGLSGLQRLNLRFNQIGDRGIAALLGSPHLAQLAHLSTHWGELTAASEGLLKAWALRENVVSLWARDEGLPEDVVRAFPFLVDDD